MTGRVLCIGTGNQLTSPGAVWADNRIYTYSPPGKIVTHFQGPEQIVEREAVYGLLKKEEPCDPRYGLLVIEDFVMRVLKERVVPVEMALANEFENKAIFGNERARSLVERWASRVPRHDSPNYGAVLIKGELPTEEEIKLGQENRKRYAMARLREAKRGQVLRMQGSRNFPDGYSQADEAWAKEFGVALEISLETASTPPRSDSVADLGEDRIACPFCAEMIMPAAKKCRFCSRTFDKKTVEEYITQPVTESA